MATDSFHPWQSVFLADPDCPTLVAMSSNKTTKNLAHTARGSRGISLFFFLLIELIEFNSLLTFLKDARERGAHKDFHTSSPLPGQVGPGLTV